MVALMVKEPSRSGGQRHHFRGSVVDSTSEPVLLPITENVAVVAVDPGTSATVQYTISSETKVQQGTAVWYPWSEGSVLGRTVKALPEGVTAVRLSSAGTSTWEVVK